MVTTAQQLGSLLTTCAVCTLVLWFKFRLAVILAANSADHPPEDAKFKLPPPPKDLKRRQRVFFNDVESVLIDLTVFWATFVVVFLQTTSGRGANAAWALQVLMVGYTVARCAYMACYYLALQPWRTMAFALGTMCSGSTALLLVAVAVDVDFHSLLSS